MNTFVECPLIIVFIVCAFLGFAVDRIYTLSAEIDELKSEVKELCQDVLIEE